MASRIGPVEPSTVRGSWPELVGQTGEEAKAALLLENSGLNVVLVGPMQPVTMDYRLDRVRVVVDPISNLVMATPHVG